MGFGKSFKKIGRKAKKNVKKTIKRIEKVPKKTGKELEKGVKKVTNEAKKLTRKLGEEIKNLGNGIRFNKDVKFQIQKPIDDEILNGLIQSYLFQLNYTLKSIAKMEFGHHIKVDDISINFSPRKDHRIELNTAEKFANGIIFLPNVKIDSRVNIYVKKGIISFSTHKLVAIHVRNTVIKFAFDENGLKTNTFSMTQDTKVEIETENKALNGINKALKKTIRFDADAYLERKANEEITKNSPRIVEKLCHEFLKQGLEKIQQTIRIKETKVIQETKRINLQELIHSFLFQKKMMIEEIAKIKQGNELLGLEIDNLNINFLPKKEMKLQLFSTESVAQGILVFPDLQIESQIHLHGKFFVSVKTKNQLNIEIKNNQVVLKFDKNGLIEKEIKLDPKIEIGLKKGFENFVLKNLADDVVGFDLFKKAREKMQEIVHGLITKLVRKVFEKFLKSKS